MRITLIAIALFCVPALTLGASGGVELEHVDIDLSNKASLQRGAKLFTNYCMGCHSAKYMRYNRVASDLGIDEDLVEDNLIFGDKKVGETMTIAMRSSDAEEWFGKAPPDLSVITRVRGEDWLYTYLKSFYLDDSRPFGVNNLVFKDVGMPHALWQLQGWQKPVYEDTGGGHGNKGKHITGLELVQEGELTPPEYSRAVRDLVAFLSYVGEPVQLKRYDLGLWVLLFLGVLFALLYSLKKDYWKDIH